MNKSYRVIWSKVRNCLVVVGENAKSHGKPSSTRKAIASAIALMLMAPVIATADITVSANTNSQVETTNN